MNSREREVFQTLLSDEKAVLAALRVSYGEALQGVNEKLANLLAQEQTQAKIYQIAYQRALQKQLEGALSDLTQASYTSIADYLTKAYENGYTGILYSLAGDGVSITSGFDPRDVLKIVNSTNDSIPLSSRLYENTSKLTGDIRQEISRGIASAMSYEDIARNIANRGEVSLHNAQRIAQTEGHRVSQSASYDAMVAAKENGADIVKQWDATLDSRTRDEHQALDGQIREVEEPFEIDGMGAQFPGDFGIPAMDINCRCVALQRARWALGEEREKYSRFDEDIVPYQSFSEFKAENNNTSGKPSQVINTRGSYATSQAEIDNILQNELRGMKLTARPQYAGHLVHGGLIFDGLTTEHRRMLHQEIPDYVTIEIGDQGSPHRKDLLDTIIHEELEARIAMGATAKYRALKRATDSTKHAYIDKVIAKYVRMAGL